VRNLVLAMVAFAMSSREARAQYPFVPPPLPCIPRSEGPGILAGIASSGTSDVPRRHLAVLQFTQLPTGDAPDVALDGLRDRLLARLRDARPRALREYVGPAQIRSQAPNERLVELATVGKQLNAQHLLVGRVAQDAGNVEISLEVFDALSGVRLWQTTRVATIPELLTLEPQLARVIAAHEFGALSIVDSLALSARETDDGEAYAHYVRGLEYLRDTATLRDASAELEAATQRVPKLAVALAALSTSYTRRAARVVADSASRDSLLHLATRAADRAVSLAPNSAQAWIARGTVLAGGNPHRLSSARVAYEHALIVDPTNAEAHRQLGHVLLLQGTADLAQSHLLRAITLDPEDASPLVDLGELELIQHAYGQSCRALDLALSINPRIALAYELRAMSRLRRGDVRPAWIDAETGRRLGAEVPGEAVAALVDVAARDTVRARVRIRRLRRELESRKWISVEDGGYVALGMVAIGDRSGALDLLERVRPRDAELYLILHRPVFDPLWADIRFRRLLEAAGAGLAK
jgi:tetratricopeptide (TPR) repeat protein